MKIGLLHRADAADVHKLSGTPFYMSKAIETHVGEVEFIGPDLSLLSRILELGTLALNRIIRAVTGKRIPADHNRLFSWQLARSFTALICKGKYDVIFAVMASAEIAALETNIPILYLADATWNGIVDYYPGATGMYKWAKREGDRIERSAMGRAYASVFPSDWAAESAIQYYGISPSRVYRVPFGANFNPEDVPPRNLALRHRSDGRVHLLWIGVNWERKGGSIAHACLLSLLNRGVDATLTVCGCIPPATFQHERLQVVPYLSKNDEAQRKRLTDLLLDASFLLFPTRADASPISICEASAHGLPVLASNTGGLAGVLHDGINGVLLTPGATGDDYAEKIVTILTDKDSYSRLVCQSRDLYDAELNWDAWALSMKPIFQMAVTETTV